MAEQLGRNARRQALIVNPTAACTARPSPSSDDSEATQNKRQATGVLGLLEMEETWTGRQTALRSAGAAAAAAAETPANTSVATVKTLATETTISLLDGATASGVGASGVAALGRPPPFPSPPCSAPATGSRSTTGWLARPRYAATSGALAALGVAVTLGGLLPEVVSRVGTLTAARTWTIAVLPLVPLGLSFVLLLVRPTDRARRTLGRLCALVCFLMAAFCGALLFFAYTVRNAELLEPVECYILASYTLAGACETVRIYCRYRARRQPRRQRRQQQQRSIELSSVVVSSVGLSKEALEEGGAAEAASAADEAPPDLQVDMPHALAALWRCVRLVVLLIGVVMFSFATFRMISSVLLVPSVTNWCQHGRNPIGMSICGTRYILHNWYHIHAITALLLLLIPAVLLTPRRRLQLQLGVGLLPAGRLLRACRRTTARGGKEGVNGEGANSDHDGPSAASSSSASTSSSPSSIVLRSLRSLGRSRGGESFTATELAEWLQVVPRQPSEELTQAELGQARAELPGDPLAATDLAGLRLCEQLGRGSCSTVHAALNVASGARVAVKLFRGGRTSRRELMAEVRLAMALDHVHLCKTLGTAVMGGEAARGLAGGCPALVMELVTGGTLHDLIFAPRASCPPCAPLALRARLARELAEAVTFLHRVDIMHCDLKPSNVLLTAGGCPSVKLCDLGLACHLPNEAGKLSGMRGTPRYMAPEVNFCAYGFPADVYSFGVCLYELLHVKPFMPMDSALARLLALVQGVRPPAQLDEADRASQGATLDERETLDDEAGRRFASVAAHIIEACWQGAWEARPKMSEVLESLTEQSLGGSVRWEPSPEGGDGVAEDGSGGVRGQRAASAGGDAGLRRKYQLFATVAVLIVAGAGVGVVAGLGSSGYLNPPPESCIAANCTLLRRGVECDSGDHNMGNQPSVEACADAVRAVGGRFFIFGIKSKTGRCFRELTASADCPEGWEVDTYNFYGL